MWDDSAIEELRSGIMKAGHVGTVVTEHSGSGSSVPIGWLSDELPGATDIRSAPCGMLESGGRRWADGLMC